MRQTLAIFLDAYRELNSRKLFWISLSISLAVVIALALPTQTERGISVFGATLEAGPFQLLGARAVSVAAFYKFIYSWVGINLWLGWGATILALISTASMVPELISSGSVELTLAKPMGRLRLFLTKYAAGLVFVALQASVFALGTVLVIGLRAHTWDARPLLIIPIMSLFFSFLHCVSVLTGMLTRSTLLSLIVVMLLWLFIWALGSVENVFLAQVTGGEREVLRIQDQQKTFNSARDMLDAQIKTLTPKSETTPPSTSASSASSDPKADAIVNSAAPAASADSEPPRRGPRGRFNDTNSVLKLGEKMKEALGAAMDRDVESLKNRRQTVQRQLDSLDSQLKMQTESLTSSRYWHNWLYGVYTTLPKTGETKDLFQRWVIDKSDWDGFLKILDDFSENNGRQDPQDALNRRPLWWIIGTSLGFEALILAIAAWIFCRRDF